MANDQSIEQLYVSIGADASQLLTQAKKAVADTEKELEKIETTGAKVFDEPTKKVKEFGKEAVKPLKQTEEEFKKLGDEGKKAFEDTEKAAKKFGDTFQRDVNGRLRDSKGRFVKFGEDGERIFNDSGKSASGFGSVLTGIAAGAATVLISKILELGTAAFSTFTQMIQQGVELNKTLENAEVIFSAVFGSPELGKATVDFLDKTAQQLNLNRDAAIQFGQSILPKTDSLETFTELLRLADIQADATGKSLDEMIFPIREALSGDFKSLRDQFDIGPEVVSKIKALTPELGAAGAIAKALNEDFQRLGKVNVTGTLSTDVKSLEAQFAGLQQRLGEPLFEQLKEEASDLGEVLSEREVDFEKVALALGQIVAQLADFTGDKLVSFLEGLDTNSIIEVANDLNEAILSIETIIDMFGDADTDEAKGFFELLAEDTENFKKAMTTAVQLVALARAEYARFTASDAIEGQKEYERILLETAAALDENKQKAAENREAQDELADASDGVSDAQTNEIDSILKANKALDDQAAALAAAAEKAKELGLELADQIEKRDEALAENAEEHAANVEEIENDHAEKVEEINQELADSLEDIEKESAKARADAHDEYADAIEDLEKEVAKKRQEILNSTKSELADLEQETDKALEEERENFQKDEMRETEDHLKEMRRLREDYLFNLEDAVGARDARAIVNLRRQYEQEKSQKEQDFQDNQAREKEDQEDRLEQIREAEEEKAQALLEAQESELLKLQEYEEEKKQLAAEKLQEQLQQIDETEAEKTAKAEEAHAEALERENEQFQERIEAENERFQERNEKAEEALNEWLENQAKALAESEDINKEGAQKVFEALDDVFGLGGKIDNMMDAFESRAKTKLTIDVGVEESFDNLPSSNNNSSSSSSSSSQNVPNNPNAANFFAKGGRVVAGGSKGPMVAVFGEAGPEMATFEPLDGGIRPQFQTTMPMMKQSGELDVNVRFENLPANYDQAQLENLVATLFVDAFNQAGFGNQ